MKVAMVSGATRGIGLSITKQLIEDGYEISAFGTRNIEEYDQFNKLYKKGHITYTKGDISKANDREKFVINTYDNYDFVNVLVNNAGVAPNIRKDILELDEDSVDRLLDINTKGSLFLTQMVAKKMIDDNPKRDRCIINISSISSEVVSTNRAEYCLSKSAISMLSKVWAVRLAEYGVNVYEIQPGIIKTDMTKVAEKKYDKLFSAGLTPIKRRGYPQDVSNAVSMLAMFKLKYTTGQVIRVDGGFTLQTL